MCANWIDKFKPHLIIELLEQLKTEEGFKSEAFNEFVSIASMIKLNAEIPEVEGNRIINDAIFESHRLKALNQQTLLSIVSRLETDYSSLPKNPYVLLTSLSIPYSNKLTPRTILDARMRFTSKVPHNFKRSQKMLDRVRTAFPEDLPDGFSIVRVEVSARGPHEAADKAFNSLDLLRSMWNISLNLSKYMWFPDMELQPINQIITGPIHSLHDPQGNHIEDRYWYDRNYPRRFLPKHIDLVNIRATERQVQGLRKNHKYQNEIDRSLIRYCRALDYPDLHTSFVKLWGLLEYLTGSERIEDIAKRTAFLYAENELVRQKLIYLRKYRNESVHSDIDSSEILKLVYQMMHFVELLIFFHLKNKMGFNSVKEAADQLLNLSPDTNQLKRQIEIRKYATGFLTPRPQQVNN